MARRSRWAVPGQMHQLMLRGNNGQCVFQDDEDRALWLDLAAREAAHHRVDVHAYVLLPARVQVLVTPHEASSLSRWMQALGRSYVRRFNQRHGRSGTLWEGRFRGGVLQAPRYALACMVFFDALPVWEGLVDTPADWPWSSHRHFVGHRVDKWLRPHATVWDLGNTPFAREAAYARLVQTGLSHDLWRALTDHAMFGWPLGDAAFLQHIQSVLGAPVQRRAAGRPKRLKPAEPHASSLYEAEGSPPAR